MILQSSISKLSNRLFKKQGGRRIPENVLERDYCIAWFLIGLSHTSVSFKIVINQYVAKRQVADKRHKTAENGVSQPQLRHVSVTVKN